MLYNIKSIISSAAAIVLTVSAMQVVAQKRNSVIDQKVNSLLSKMTIEEKIGQLNQYTGKALTGPASEKQNNLQAEIKGGWVGSMLNVKGAKNTHDVQAIAMQS